MLHFFWCCLFSQFLHSSYFFLLRVKMGSRHWHTGMQFPAATKPTFQSPNFGPVYWPNALPRDEELIKAYNCHYEILQAFLVETPQFGLMLGVNSSELTLRPLKQKERPTSDRSLLLESEACQRPPASHRGLCYCYWLYKEGSRQHTSSKTNSRINK